MLIVNVDGFGTDGEAIHSQYYELIAAYPFAGCLPHFGTTNPHEIQKAIQKLQQKAPRPLWIALDIQELRLPDGTSTFVGFGYGGGLIGRYGARPKKLLRIVDLQIQLHQALGINLALGPTIDQSTRNGFLQRPTSETIPIIEKVLTVFKNANLDYTLKHYPFTPQTYNLHRQSPDLELTWVDIQKRTAIFREFAPDVDFLMTTHVLSQKVAPHLATLSPEWINGLKQETQFEGLIMADALLMLRGYEANLPLIRQQWNALGGAAALSDDSIFVALSILAGHHLLILEGTASDTRRVLSELSQLAQSDSELAVALNEKILMATKAIKNIKNRRHFVQAPSMLSNAKDINQLVMQLKISLN
jgi:hypothetical protein